MKPARSSTPADLPPGGGNRLGEGRLHERALIEEIRARAGASPGWLPVGIGDDAAVVKPERGALDILTTDAVVEGVHFDRRFSTLRDVGWKALAVNLSDIAAMGGTPRLALLSLGLPDTLSATDVHELLDGFFALASDARVTLAGGNITRSPGPLFVDVTVTGFARPRHVLTRGGARAGDALYVTGEVGAASAGLRWLKDTAGARDTTGLPGIEACVRRHRAPVPRVRAGVLLGRNRAASACMDLSDGLADAVRQLAAASGLGAVVDGDALPIPAAARACFERAGFDPVTAAAAGGDDYELLFAVPRRARGRLATVVRQARGVPMTRIGELTASPDLVLMNTGRREQLPEGFVHF